MRVLIFDTETTGLPKKWKMNPERECDNWPHIVSIAWLVLDSESNTIETQKSYVVKPINWTIPEDATAIHGIRDSFARDFGSPLADVIREFFETPCDMYVAHNMNFDENVIMNAVYWDLDGELYRFDKPTICTMKLATPMCKLRFSSGGGTKPPKLSELYEHVFRRKPVTAKLHGAFYDAKILTEIIQHHEPLRVAMGLVASKPVKSNGLPPANAVGSTLIL
jgi:DNA polymerase III epsilon subunit-like protein